MTKGLRYGDLHLDTACISALLAMLPEIAARGIRSVVVFSPVNPEFRQRYPGTMHRCGRSSPGMRKEADPKVAILDNSPRPRGMQP